MTEARKRLRPSELPEVESAATYAWREGWWNGIVVGFVIGLGLAVVFLRR